MICAADDDDDKSVYKSGARNHRPDLVIPKKTVYEIEIKIKIYRGAHSVDNVLKYNLNRTSIE